MKTTIQTLLYGVLCALAHASEAVEHEHSAESKTGSNPGGGVVKSLNGLDGMVSLRAGDNVTIVPSRNGLTISAAVAAAGGGDSNRWHRTGDIIAPGEFLGTLNHRPLEFKANGQRALRLEPNTNDAANVIGGSSLNFVAPGVVGATVAGGGSVYYESILTGSFNQASNSVSSDFGSIGGGVRNEIKYSSSGSTIAGGSDNIIQGQFATISGGSYGLIGHGAAYSAIGGGGGNAIGEGDAHGSVQSTIAGGLYNAIRDDSVKSVIGGGERNLIQQGSELSSIAGGLQNVIQTNSAGSTIGGGIQNNIQNKQQFGYSASTIAGGEQNAIGNGANRSSIGGGSRNLIKEQSYASTIAGGAGNAIDIFCSGSTIAGGFENTVGLGDESAIGGGLRNTVYGRFGVVPGGDNNRAGQNSFAAGHRANAQPRGSFVWADSTDADVSATLNNQFVARASGGVVFYSNPDLGSGVFLSPGGGSWSTLSDRSTKENVEPVNGRTVLDQLCAMPLAAWNYKTQDKSIRHIGPMAQDFHAAFGVGEDEKHIATVDADGVALAAIQGLNDLVREKDARISELEKRLSRLENLLTKQKNR